MSELDELIAEAELGKAAEEFLASDLGRVLIGMADQEVALAQEELEGAPATDSVKIREIQNRAWRARQFKQWLAELVDKGKQAIEIFKQHERDD